MDEPVKGIVDQPVSDEDMAAVEESANQVGSVVQPSTDPADDPVDSPLQDPTPPSEGPPKISSVGSISSPSQADDDSSDTVNPLMEDTPNGEHQTGPTGSTPGAFGSSEDDTFSESEATVEQPQYAADPPAEKPTDPPVIGGEETPTPTPVTDDSTDDSQDETPVPTPVSDEEVEQANVTPIVGAAPTDDQPPAIQASDNDPIQQGEGNDDELLDVKQKALEELTPLIDNLDLPVEDRFETLMMIIRASDDKKLVKPAFEAAHSIEDEDKKAKALLDVVNEVNYLTQGQES